MDGLKVQVQVQAGRYDEGAVLRGTSPMYLAASVSSYSICDRGLLRQGP